MSNLVLPAIIFFLGFITYSRALAKFNAYGEYNYGDNDDGYVDRDGEEDGYGSGDADVPEEPEVPECECANILLLDKNSGTKYS